MRLIHIQDDGRNDGSLRLSMVELTGSEIDGTPYAILSHRWRDDEVLFVDMAGDGEAARLKKGYSKLMSSCKVAFERGLLYLWCDTCCIDKSSSAELSEAINAMYEYYAKSAFCIAYLDDIEDLPNDEDALTRATWFSRGWTLQELLAPKKLYYYSRDWKKLGSKSGLSRQTSLASGIHENILLVPHLSQRACVSEKMSWAACRTTTRAEDQAYSLMGLFGVHMPPLYGEGAENAFRRLQLEILQKTNDHTLFAWDSAETSGDMVSILYSWG
ncbi:hypothetical protein FB567DRAFT_596248 [Paraphoma chrysanthemicola]|uniref:Heterokaryon incompatibility domain-containing protein n=1 Tax=Paraphoma chrysanthemicola TaxID=798071 RepID=A0A8K0QXW5_9PLEO|nr:hypothetical protein FB567DRAFT_596248 [Paraphoma chrysanthemicola]